MSWVITPSNLLVDDQDALTYLAAVEAADGQALESATRLAVNAFVKGCKADGIWPAIKASCILAGARTLTGALVPLAGPAPTNFNFVAGDYNRKTGLVGNGVPNGDPTAKYLNSNRAGDADPQDNEHIAAYITQLATSGGGQILGNLQASGNGSTRITQFGGNLVFRSNTSDAQRLVESAGFCGLSRSIAASFNIRAAGVTEIASITSQQPSPESIGVFARVGNVNSTNARLSFYSIGESLNLALLDTRVSQLMTDYANAIP